MQPDAARTIQLATTDPDPTSNDIGRTLLFPLPVRPARSDVPASRVLLQLMAPAAQSVVVDLWSVIDDAPKKPGDELPDPIPAADLRFALLEAGITLTGSRVVTRDIPPGTIYTRVVTNNLASTPKKLVALALAQPSSLGASGGAATNVNATIVGPLGVQAAAAGVTVTEASGQEWSLVRQNGAIASSFQISPTAITARSIFGWIDSTCPSGVYFPQLFNNTSATGTPVANGMVNHQSGLNTPFTLALNEKGSRFATALTIGLSSTKDTFTGAAFMMIGGASVRA